MSAFSTLTLQALLQHGLLLGKNLGIDASVIEANASLRVLVDRNTEEQYCELMTGPGLIFHPRRNPISSLRWFPFELSTALGLAKNSRPKTVPLAPPPAALALP